ncbi:BamA/TamA family outer membrane protein [Aliifodinibius sp. S!AR15-10]|uniref:BamA/OMP85 family outer membrane protein n=1 Tax=Aliifodinibius sp. S!AR15-10 TaxID=2950437 RepID=UPI0028577AF7|nr:BamA/TamA family outer membrane protein [Aliifodinibius sp. S!AR15-10]MDR8391241.1 BamA/TamA family outer membrane protein [Aliifodinibius sp. S!AR15-10]
MKSFFILFVILFLEVFPGYAFQNGVDSDVMDPQVWRVEIEGNKTFSDLVIKQIIATESPTTWEKMTFWKRGGHEFNDLEIQRDVIRIRRYYERRGFPNVQVRRKVETGKKSWRRIVRFIIDENSPVTITRLDYQFKTTEENREYITSSRAYRQARSDHSFQLNQRYQTIREPDIIGMFNNALKNLGYAFADVNILAEVDSLQTTASVTIELMPGPVTYFDQVNVTGVETVSENYIIREADIDRGEKFSQNKLEQAQREIFNHHLFRFATINVPEQEHDSTLAVDINLREYPLRSIQVLGGVGTEDLLRGQVSWTHRNLFHRGHRLTATARASFIEQSLNLDYLLPYTFNTKSSVVISPFAQHVLERRIYELFHGGVTNSFIYRYRQDLTGTVSYQFTRNLELSEQFDEALPDTTFEYNLSSFQLSGYYSPGFTSREQQGWVVQPYLEFSGLFGGAAFSFQKFSLDVRRFTKLTNSTTLATRMQLGGIGSVKQDSLPQNIRFYLGGTSSVRGWGRNELGPKRARFDSTDAFYAYAPIGGQAQFGFNAEIRQNLDPFIKGFGMTVFLDGGQVWRRLYDLQSRPMQFSVGGGLRYQSPIGPIRVDIGYKLNPTDEDLNIYQGTDYGGRFDRFGIHFSVGQAF